MPQEQAVTIPRRARNDRGLLLKEERQAALILARAQENLAAAKQRVVGARAVHADAKAALDEHDAAAATE
jgi:hypothetical protein